MSDKNKKITPNKSAVLETWKSRESQIDLVIFHESPLLQRLVKTWKQVQIHSGDAGNILSRANENDVETLIVWGNISVSLNEVAALAQIPRSMVKDCLLQALKMHLIYPDGAINKFASIYITNVFNKELVRIGVAEDPNKPKDKPKKPRRKVKVKTNVRKILS